jgi:hypothetical protein
MGGVRAWLGAADGPRLWLPGELREHGWRHEGGLLIPQAQVAGNNGVEVVDAAVTRARERITLAGVLRRGDLPAAVDELQLLDEFLQAIGARGDRSSYAVQFGWEDADTGAGQWHPCCYVEAWELDRQTLMPGAPWRETGWRLVLLVPDPDAWTTGDQSAGALPDTVIIQAERIVLAVGEELVVRDGQERVQLRLNVKDQALAIAGEYRFLP